MKTHRPTPREEDLIATQGPLIVTEYFPDIAEGKQFGSLNKPALGSRVVIGDNDFDDITNFTIFPTFLQQVFGPSLIATLPAGAFPIVWARFLPLNSASFLFILGANGHFYQVSVSGTITDTFTASTFTQSGTLNGTTTVTGLSNTANMIVGGGVSGTDIQPGTTIAQILSSTSIRLSLAATGSGTFTLTFTPPTISSKSDIDAWQGTQILVSDLNNNSVYQWNGTILTAVFQNQPAQYLAVFNGRLWFTNGGAVIQFTAAGTYNNLGGDAGNVTITEADFLGPVIGLIPSQGLLYAIGYGAMQQIGNLYETTLGPISTLNFTRNTAINQVGAFTKWSVTAFDYFLIFALTTGIWSYYGSTALWTSEMIGGFFQAIVTASTSLSSAFCIINQLPLLFWQFAWTNPTTNATEYTILGLDTSQLSNGVFRWMRFIPQTSMGVNIPISFICSGIDQGNNGVQKIWGIDTSGNIYQLFANAAASVTSIANTKLWNGGAPKRVKLIERGGAIVLTSSNASYSINGIDQLGNIYPPDVKSAPPSNLVTFVYSNGAPATFKYSGGAPATFFKNVSQYVELEWDLPCNAKCLGFNFSLTGINSYLYSFQMEYAEEPADWGA